MLKSHIDGVEGTLLEQFKASSHAGHPGHIGTPREAFVREFLQGHLSEQVAVGTGEIIDATAKSKEPRNQIDIVIYRRDYPRLDLGGGITGFLAESVLATIEVKSRLTKGELQKAIRSAKRLKVLERHYLESNLITSDWPLSILSYVVAYSGPSKMTTVSGWQNSISTSEGIDYPDLPAFDRWRISSPALDGIFVLGKGLIHFGNSSVGFFHAEHLELDPKQKWAVAEANRGSLLMLFLLLTTAASGLFFKWLNPRPYLRSFSADKVWSCS